MAERRQGRREGEKTGFHFCLEKKMRRLCGCIVEGGGDRSTKQSLFFSFFFCFIKVHGEKDLTDGTINSV